MPRFLVSAVWAALLVSGLSESLEAKPRLRVAHFSPDAPPVDIMVNDEVVLSGVEFGQVSDYLELISGEFNIKVTPAGELTTVVIDANLVLENQTVYTVAATGLLGTADLSPIVLVDDVLTVEGTSKVRFIHTSPDAPPVDIAVAGGDVLFPNVAFRENGDYLEVPEGTYDLEVRLAGTMNVALSIPGVELAGETNYDIFAIGEVGNTTLAALPVVTAQPTNLPVKVRVAHLSPDAPAVDVWVNGSVVLEAVPFQGVSDYLTLEAGSYNVQVTPTGVESPVVIDADLELEEGKSYTVAATGLLADEALQPAVLLDDRAIDVANAKVRFVHFSPDAPSVDVAVTGGPVLFSDVSFRESGDYLPVEPGTYDLEVRLAGTETVALAVPGVEVNAGINVTIFAAGLASDGSLSALSAIDRNERFLRGDSNSDLSVNISDAVVTLRHLFLESLEFFCADAADANDDGHVNTTDPIYTLEFQFLGGPSPAMPFPETGVDLTDDGLVCRD